MRARVCCGVVFLIALAVGAGADAQTLSAPEAPPAPPTVLASIIRAEPSGETATFTFFNRPVVVLRARVLGRSPGDRAASAVRIVDALIDQGITGPVQSRRFNDGAIISVGPKPVLALTAPDVDELSGETVEGVSAATVARLTQAIGEAVEARTPGRLLRSSVLAATALAFTVLALWGVARARRTAAARLDAAAQRKVVDSGLVDIQALRASRLLEFQRRFLTTGALALSLVIVYAALTSILRRFPYTRPWGESLLGFFVSIFETLGLGIVNAIPGLITVVVIALLTRFLIRVVALWFTAVEAGKVKPRWLHPETAQPTRRLITALLWVFAAIVAYPYLPGSQTDAFKGVSVFLGLMVTLGSTGLVSHIMSGFTITYSRALRTGDFVKIGDLEGTVTHLGILSTKVLTLKREEVTIPNSVVVSQTITDYSRLGDSEGVFTATSVTIGYDTPWRQVHSLLLAAAERTEGLRREPKPMVTQEGLQDFYVKYTLMVCLERQQDKLVTMNALHANIQDLFNEYGVQIMSPNYVVDPAAPKIVKKENWYAAPAAPDRAQVVAGTGLVDQYSSKIR